MIGCQPYSTDLDQLLLNANGKTERRTAGQSLSRGRAPLIKNMNDPENLVAAIYRAVDWINGELPPDRQLIKARETRLLGSQLVLGSDAPCELDRRDRAGGGGHIWRDADVGRRAGAFDERESVLLDPVTSPITSASS
jgi:hypothetical protein